MVLMRFEIEASTIDPRPRRVRPVTLLQRLANLMNPYRPYKHYMRGPGPKCREKEAVEQAKR